MPSRSIPDDLMPFLDKWAELEKRRQARTTELAAIKRQQAELRQNFWASWEEQFGMIIDAEELCFNYGQRKVYWKEIGEGME